MERAEQTLGTSFYSDDCGFSANHGCLPIRLKCQSLGRLVLPKKHFNMPNDYLDIVLGGVAFMVIGFFVKQCYSLRRECPCSNGFHAIKFSNQYYSRSHFLFLVSTWA